MGGSVIACMVGVYMYTTKYSSLSQLAVIKSTAKCIFRQRKYYEVYIMAIVAKTEVFEGYLVRQLIMSV